MSSPSAVCRGVESIFSPERLSANVLASSYTAETFLLQRWAAGILEMPLCRQHPTSARGARPSACPSLDGWFLQRAKVTCACIDQSQQNVA